MDKTFKYATMTEALDNLSKKGYTIDYNVEFDQLSDEAAIYEIDVLYRYEGESDPADESSVYGIRNTKTDEKGVFVAGNLSLIEGKKRDIILDLEMKYKQNHH
ncbi:MULTISPECIES: hypothetical protein [Sphingobacterium]|uniref:Phosphoribosylpyrophosphate synthetase n=1 Tax=Sphingobacterium cellulitidis TaxID=1768011 RepID=A0A8H9FYR4_9SPHI|nr:MULTISPECIES: hypothetical protein [Sphingobacterium]MBA8986540.1 hypothetical protein [Sphingobacterium soli]OYD42582.1 hypothetical protein CHT99_07090 [Sphingobacterium cellulitidis]OYD45193.1 hypothetical protein CHU00_13170 [Sphingobacterium cellulitidis]WFB61900.1 hypothetical protein PZ892_09415 [Sphingobacterium sp. WM]GGE21017.1 hypothetical protein GCM10011516_18370 [Sphingobacterium soli]